MQFALQTQSFSPGPEIVEIELGIGVGDDCHDIIEIARPACN